MMAGAKAVNRARFTAAGYTGSREELELYIAKAPAGSAQDNLRDFNKRAYRSERPWNEEQGPEVLLAQETPSEQPKRRRKTKKSFFDKLIWHARRDKQGVAICLGLCCAMLMMIAAWGGEMVDGVVIARDIAAYQTQTRLIETENESLLRQLELASTGERIRNLAQNELGMLRPERATQEVIYIRTTDRVVTEAQPEASEPRMELLDILLGLLNVFHIGE